MDITPIAARLSIIANSVNALKRLQTLTYDEFAHDHIVQSAVEHDFQVAIQSALDIGSMLLAEQSVSVPEDYAAIFPKLAEIGILPDDFAQRLVGMAKFRNVLVHLYLHVDLKKVYRYLQEELDDFERFAQYVSEHIARMGW